MAGNEMRVPGVPSSKQCRDCGLVKPAAEFWRRKQSADGLALYCKECFGLRNASSYRGRQAQAGKEARPYRRHSAVPSGMKYCPNCKEIKPLSGFGRNRSNTGGRAAYCRPCHNEVMAAIKQRTHGSTRNYHLKRRYGLTEEQVAETLAGQGGICVICLRTPAAHVDHNHETGLFRGLLCFSCNGGLGQFDDDPRRLRDAAVYLEARGPHARRMVLDLGRVTIDGSAQRFDGRQQRERSGKPGKPGTRRYKLRDRYGITDEDERRILEVQHDLCPVCCDLPARDVDHDHVTGAVRGVLCSGCNSGMGQLGDDPGTLRRAADYVDGTLIDVVQTGDGETRMSFTFPDVDPTTVPLDGWAPYKQADGRHRRALLQLVEETEYFRWLEISFDEAYPH